MEPVGSQYAESPSICRRLFIALLMCLCLAFSIPKVGMPLNLSPGSLLLFISNSNAVTALDK